jgi:hypothetical protein
MAEVKKAAPATAPAKATAAPAPAIEADAQYLVKLRKAVTVAGTLLSPRKRTVLKGKHIAALGRSVVSYEKL